MQTSYKPLSAMTAADVMNSNVISLPQHMPLRDAAKQLAAAGIHGAPVVDSDGRCVGVFSTSDLARWARNRASPPPLLPRTCQYQEKVREIDGEVVLCLLGEGACPLQQRHHRTDGSTVTACAEPHCVPVDWQVVDTETLPKEDVQHYMTTCAVTASRRDPISSLARRMIDRAIRRIIVLDEQGRPIGIVSSSDLIAALAEPPMLEEELP